jgi:hypothetical protein
VYEEVCERSVTPLLLPGTGVNWSGSGRDSNCVSGISGRRKWGGLGTNRPNSDLEAGQGGEDS